MQTLEAADIALRLGAAVGLSALLGVDRERKERPAGLRTLMLVGLGSALFGLSGWQLMVDMGVPSAAAGDSLSRIYQGVIGGIGFLGAGTILKTSNRVKGVTTAATVWVTAAIGLACGVGQLALGLITCAFALVTLTAVKLIEPKIREDNGVPGRDEAGAAGSGERGGDD